jgi:hypothetical protein
MIAIGITLLWELALVLTVRAFILSLPHKNSGEPTYRQSKLHKELKEAENLEEYFC